MGDIIGAQPCKVATTARLLCGQRQLHLAGQAEHSVAQQGQELGQRGRQALGGQVRQDCGEALLREAVVAARAPVPGGLTLEHLQAGLQGSGRCCQSCAGGLCA